MSTLYAQSTIAMTSYNCIAAARKALGASDIHEGISHQHPETTEDEVIEALTKLVKMGHIYFDKDVGYDIKDPKRRVIVTRDLGDSKYDHDGNPVGGWNGWTVRDSDGSLMPMAKAKGGII